MSTDDHDPSSLSAVPIGRWLERLAAPVPDPGGGAAAGLVIGVGAALVSMAARYVTPDSNSAAVVTAADGAREAALLAADADALMSAALVAAYRLPDDCAERAHRICEASLHAAESSGRLVEIAASLLEPLRWLQKFGEQRLAPDVAVAARLLAAGIRSSAVNIRCDTTAAEAVGASATALARLRETEGWTHDIAGELDALAGDVTAGL